MHVLLYTYCTFNFQGSADSHLSGRNTKNSNGMSTIEDHKLVQFLHDKSVWQSI